MSTVLFVLSRSVFYGGISAFALVAAVPVWSQVGSLAQVRPGSGSSAVADAQLKSQFAKGFTQGCMASSATNIPNKKEFCGCLLTA